MEERQHKRSLLESLFRFFFYPFYVLFTGLFSSQSILKKIIVFFYSFLILFPLWLLEISAFTLGTGVILQFAGLATLPVPVQGPSMLPTLPSQGYVFLKRYPPIEQLKPKIKRGDLVVFENERTREELSKEGKNSTGFVKRVIAITGDKVKIRDGFVYVNDNFVEEPYTLKPRSTFGGKEIPDCQEIKVPEGQVFVLGDNRKISMDSRHIGLINLKDIQFYLDYKSQQKEFALRWRDVVEDAKAANTSVFDVKEYLQLVNKEREKKDLNPLKHQLLLDRSARLRAEAMLKYDDLSFEATRSAYSMEEAVEDVGYSNIIYGEVPTLGYYDSQELFDSFFEFSESRDFLLKKDYQEIGLSTFVGELHGCPAQIVVQHLAGYIAPNYSSETVVSWRDLVNKLREVQPSWQSIKDSKDFYDDHKSDVDRMNEIIVLRISRAEVIASRLEANQWLTEEEIKYMEEDDDLAKEQDNLADKLNDEIEKR